MGAVTAVMVIVTSGLVARIVAHRFEATDVWLLPLAVLGAFVLRAAVAWVHGIVSDRASIRVKQELREELVDDLLDPRRLGPRPSSSRLMTLLGPGMDAFDGYIGRFLPQLGLALVVPALVIAAVAWTDLLSGIIIVLTLPLIGVFMALVGLMTQDRVDRRWAAMERLGRHFADVLDGLVVFKIFGRRQEAGLEHIGQRHREESIKALRLAFLSTLVLELVSTISVALVAVSVGLRVVDDKLSLVNAMFVLILAPEAYLPVRRVGLLFHDSQEGATATMESLDVLEHDRHTGELPAPLGPVTIEAEGVSVTHPGRQRRSLDVPHLVIHPGEHVALIGPSGSGKSTFLALMLGFERADTGRITADGVDLAEIDPVQWRRHLAWVPQNPQVVAGTIIDNVTLAADGVDPAAVQRALEDVGLTDIDPARVLAEGAPDLSAGERRRLALARALVRVRHQGAWLVLLDEPTAGLDADREQRVLEAISALGATVLVVTHRPDTVAWATRIVALHVDEVVS